MRPSFAGTRIAAALGLAALAAGAVAAAPAVLAGPDDAEPASAMRVRVGAPPPAAAPPEASPRSVPAFLAPGGDAHHEFYFTRAVYSDGRGMRGGWGRRGSWATDYPKADRQFLVVLKRLVGIDAYERENAVSLADPELRRFPYLYALEVGGMRMSEEEVLGLRSYLEAGGFLVIDDFWGTYEWDNFEREMARVFPGRQIEDLPLDHPIFNAYYDITEVRQVPQVGLAERIALGWDDRTWECAGCTPRVRGIFDDERRLMVVINFNTDLGDAWEWAEDPYYPLEYSTYAFEVGVNMIVYAMSH
ncbi:MAG: DUF4159 domain-containing protein [Gemmatimonadetes bacterium]|nr:DUF4159 domain-containing protein [Gemmatimonadota bacterium]